MAACAHLDSSPGRHARGHFHATRHPLIEPLPGAQWTWCYIDDAYVERGRPARAPDSP